LNRHNVAGATRVLNRFSPGPFTPPRQFLCDDLQLTLGDVDRKIRHDRLGSPGSQLSTSQKIQSLQLTSRLDYHADPSAACRVETRSFKPCLDSRSHSVDQRQKSLLEKIKRRSERIMRAAFKNQSTLSARYKQRRQHSLKHERGAARRPNREGVVTGNDAAGCERQLARADHRTRDFATQDLSGSIHRGEVLP